MSRSAAQHRKLVLFVADGLRADTARNYMGFLRAMLDAGRAQWSTLRCELPGISRPLYATLISGKRPLEHGIISNQQVGKDCGTTLFDALAAQGLGSAIAAYHWFFELLAGETFDPFRHRHAALPERGVAGASWYFEDDYSDSHLLADAEHLRALHKPALLLAHAMGPDHAGHLHGGESDAYALSARKLDMMLALALPHWHANGYDVLFTSDHGMHADRMHGGPLEQERDVPLVWLPRDADDDATPPDTQVGIHDFVLHRLLGSQA